jgi:isopentenyldiphosphate isomerase
MSEQNDQSGGELVEWVDEFERVIEVVTRARMRGENLRHRSVGVIVMSSDGRMLAQRRAETKDLHPGWWDIGVGGVVGVGESYDVAAERELAEEIGVIGADLEALGIGRWDDDHSMEICHLYRIVSDGPFEFPDGEVTEVRLLTPDQFADLTTVAPFLPSSLAMLLPLIDGFETG